MSWRVFCEKIDEVFTIKGLEKHSGTTLTHTNFDVLIPKPVMTERETHVAEDFKTRFTFFCKATRLDVK